MFDKKTLEYITSGYNIISNTLATLNENKIRTGGVTSACIILAIYFTLHTENTTQKPPTPQSTLYPTPEHTHKPTGAPTAGPTPKPIPDPEGVPYFMQLDSPDSQFTYIAGYQQQHATGFVSVGKDNKRVRECLGLTGPAGNCYPSQNGRTRIVDDQDTCRAFFNVHTPEVNLCYDHNMQNKNKEHLRGSTTSPQ